MNIEKILTKVSKEKGFGRIMLSQCVTAFLNAVAVEVDKGNDVQIPEFGTFKPSTVKSHKLSFDTNIIVPAKTTIIFSADECLKKFINEEDQSYTLHWKKITDNDNT